MNNAPTKINQAPVALKCLNPAYSEVYPVIARAVSALVDHYRLGRCADFETLIKKLDLATRVYYEPSSRFPYVRQSFGTGTEDMLEPDKKAALIDVITDNVTVLILRGVGPAEQAMASVVLEHLDLELLHLLLQESHINTLDFGRAKTLIIGTISRRHDASAWRSLNDTINSIS